MPFFPAFSVNLTCLKIQASLRLILISHFSAIYCALALSLVLARRLLSNLALLYGNGSQRDIPGDLWIQGRKSTEGTHAVLRSDGSVRSTLCRDPRSRFRLPP